MTSKVCPREGAGCWSALLQSSCVALGRSLRFAGGGASVSIIPYIVTMQGGLLGQQGTWK